MHTPTSTFASVLCVRAQDSCLEVRSRFENKLHKWLARMVLPVAYLSILALGAPDPVKDQRNHVSQALSKTRLHARWVWTYCKSRKFRCVKISVFREISLSVARNFRIYSSSLTHCVRSNRFLRFLNFRSCFNLGLAILYRNYRN